MNPTPTVTLDKPVTMSRELLERAVRDLRSLRLRHAIGHNATALETVAVLLLNANGHMPNEKE